MKVVFTGGSTGGHFYPIIAVAEALQQLAREKKYLNPSLYYFGPKEYDKNLLAETEIQFQYIAAGKQRRGYGMLKNFLDIFVTIKGIFQAVWFMYRVFPDVVFSKGSYAAFPTLVAARLFGIPVIIHESDSRPGRVNMWASAFAKKIAISYPSAADQFKRSKNVALTGNPIREHVGEPIHEGAHEYFDLSEDIPTIFVIGGSQGAQMINEVVLSSLHKLVDRAQIIHQTGPDHIKDIENTSRVILEKHRNRERYMPLGFLDKEGLRYAAGAADLVITRAGSMLFEIARWSVPALVVPIPEPFSHDQRSNAYAYAQTGAAEVIEEKNLTVHILLSQIDSILSDSEKVQEMKNAAAEFGTPGAAEKIAQALFDIGLEHAE